MSLLSHYLHTAILIQDLARSEQFYGQVLELPVAKRDLKFPGIWYQIGSIQIHLIVSEHVISDQVDERWGRNRHFAFAVLDLNQVKERLERYHYPIQMSASGRLALFTQDPDGNIIELSQIELSSVNPEEAPLQ
jgi:catechol 2,3-dioxygenase-like lactoylglutathione lyase family enzyme